MLAAPSVERDELNAMAHRLIFCAQILVQMRPWLFSVFALLRVAFRTRRGRILLSPAAKVDLRRCLYALRMRGADGAHFASARGFPSLEDGARVSYADAAVELERRGYGGWAVLGRLFVYIVGVTDALVTINALELWATTATVVAVALRDRTAEYFAEYSDNTSAEAVAARSSAAAPQMQLLLQRRDAMLGGLGVFCLPQRVSSEANEFADWLSRGRERDVLAAVAAAGLRAERLDVPEELLALLAECGRLPTRDAAVAGAAAAGAGRR